MSNRPTKMPRALLATSAIASILTLSAINNAYSSDANPGTNPDAQGSAKISVINRAPIADAGKTIIATRGSKVSLDGSASNDPDNDAISYSWQQVYGPVVTLAGPTSANPSFTMPHTSGYVIFALTVNDGKNESITDTVTVKINNTAPIAKITNITDNIIAGEKVSLDGSASSDAEGDALVYHWKQVLGTPVVLQDAESATPTFTAPQISGHLIFELSVNDGEFTSHTATVVVSVKHETPLVDTNPVIETPVEANEIPVLPMTTAPKASEELSIEAATSTIPSTTEHEEVINANSHADNENNIDTGLTEKVQNRPVLPITIAPESNESLMAGSDNNFEPIVIENPNSETASADSHSEHLVNESRMSTGLVKNVKELPMLTISEGPASIENYFDKNLRFKPIIVSGANGQAANSGLVTKSKEFAVLPVVKAPAPVEDFLSELTRDFKPATTTDSRNSLSQAVATDAHSGKKNETSHSKGHWSYAGATGPEHWAELDEKFTLCGTGKNQSPIDIQTAGLQQQAKPIEFNYSTSTINVINNGHTIQVDYDPGSYAVIEGKRFDLLQFHFHSPSENTIDDTPADLVAHMVHKAEDGQLAVVGILFRQGNENQFLTPIWANLPSEAGMKTSSSNTIFAANMLPKERGYYHYSGSLTTPPCSENVNWNVIATVQEASSTQIEAFTSLFAKSVRPVQPLFDRVITLN